MMSLLLSLTVVPCVLGMHANMNALPPPGVMPLAFPQMMQDPSFVGSMPQQLIMQPQQQLNGYAAYGYDPMQFGRMANDQVLFQRGVQFQPSMDANPQPMAQLLQQQQLQQQQLQQQLQSQSAQANAQDGRANEALLQSMHAEQKELEKLEAAAKLALDTARTVQQGAKANATKLEDELAKALQRREKQELSAKKLEDELAKAKADEKQEAERLQRVEEERAEAEERAARAEQLASEVRQAALAEVKQAKDAERAAEDREQSALEQASLAYAAKRVAEQREHQAVAQAREVKTRMSQDLRSAQKQMDEQSRVAQQRVAEAERIMMAISQEQNAELDEEPSQREESF